MTCWMLNDFNLDDELVGFQCWDADRITPPGGYAQQVAPPDAYIIDKNGKPKYKKNPNNPKKWDDGSLEGAPNLGHTKEK